MQSNKTIEDVLGAEPQRTIEDILGPPEPQGPLHGGYWDDYFSHGMAGDMTAAWGPFSLHPDLEKAYKQNGVPKEAIDHHNDVAKDYNEQLFRPGLVPFTEPGVPTAQAGLLSGFQTGFVAGATGEKPEGEGRLPGGVPAAIGAVPGVILGSLLGSLPYQAYKSTEKMLSGELITPEEGAAAAGAIAFGMHGIAPYRAILGARDLGILNEIKGEPQAIEALSPTGVPSKTEQVVIPPSQVPSPAIPEGVAEPTAQSTERSTDVQTLARQMRPDTMNRYDDLTTRKQMLTTQLNNQIMTEARPFQEQIDTILSKVNGIEDRLTNAARERLEAARHNLAYTIQHDSPERQAIRLERNGVDADLRELAPDVNAAIREARDTLPPDAMPEVVAPAEPTPVIDRASMLDDGTIRYYHGTTFDNVDSFTGKTFVTPDEDYARNYRGGPNKVFYTDIPKSEAIEKGLFDEINNFPINGSIDDAATRLKPLETAPQIQTLAQRRVPIWQQVSADLREAGRPTDEAQAAGRLVQAHYQAMSDAFNGALGNAQDMYDKFAPTVVSAEGRTRGALDLTQNVIRLTQNADASTFVHETAHGWLEEMLQLAQHEEAPTQIKDDLNAVKAWLGMEGERPTRKQHEKFARGFERYLMEGTAPSTGLAGVFEKFRNWLTTIYQTVTRLRSPINDEIRGVYDRLLAGPPRETTILPELEVEPRTIGEIHERQAARVEPEAVEERADDMSAQRQQVAEMLSTEIANARRRSRLNGPQGRPTEAEPAGAVEGAPGRTGVPTEDEIRSEPIAIGEEPAGATGEERFSGVEPTPEPPAGQLVDDKGIVQFDNLNRPEDVDAAIGKIYGRRGGPPTEASFVRLAEGLGVSTRNLDRDAIAGRFGEAEMNAARVLLDQSATKLRELATALADGEGDPLEFARQVARHALIQTKIRGMGAEWGRMGVAIQNLYREMGGKAEALDGLFKETLGRGYDTLMQMAINGQNIRSTRVMSKFINQTMIQKGFGAVVYYYTNSILSGIITHGVYGIGNMMRVVGMVPLSAAQALSADLRGAAVDRVYWREVGESLAGLIQGTKDAISPSIDAFKAGRQLPLPGEKAYVNPWGAYAGPVNPMLDKVIGWPGKMVAGVHQFSRVQFYTQHLYRQTVRQALDEGLMGEALEQRIADLRQNTPTELNNEVIRKAETDMFQRIAQYDGLVAAMSRFADTHPMARIMLPFVRIGMEIERETLKATPGAAFTIGDVRAAFRQGGASMDEAAGKQIIGLGLLGTGVGLAASGVITGYGPLDPKERAAWLLDHKPYHVDIGPLSFGFQGLGPPGILLQFAADMYEISSHWDEMEGKKLALAYGKAVQHALLDEAFFRDVHEIFQAIDDPVTAGSRYIGNIMAGFVPYSALQGQINRNFIDPYSKDIEPGIQAIIDTVRARTIGASLWQPDALDMFGRPLYASGGIVSTVPPPGARYAGDPTVVWLNRLGVGIAKPQRQIGGVRLTEEQYTRYRQLSGVITKRILDGYARSGIPQQPRNIQIQMLSDVGKAARAMAAARVNSEWHGEILRKSVQQRAFGVH